MVHWPASWATAVAATSSRPVASPPDSNLKRFIADLMLRMRVVKNGARYLPVRVEDPPILSPEARVLYGRQPSSDSLQTGIAARDRGYIPHSSDCQSVEKPTDFSLKRGCLPARPAPPPG